MKYTHPLLVALVFALFGCASAVHAQKPFLGKSLDKWQA